MKKLVIALSIAWLGAGIAAVYLWQELSELRGRKDSLQARVQALETRGQPGAGLAALAPAAGAAAAPADAAQPAAATGPAEMQPARDMTRTMLRATMARQYPDLEQELDLRPQEVDKFLDLLTSQRMDSATSGEANQAALSAMLGNRMAQWEEYQQTLPARQQVTALRGELAISGSSLPEAQARPLMTALDAEMKLIQQEARRSPQPANPDQQQQMQRELERTTASNRRLVQAAKPHLSAGQLDSYRKLLDQQTEMARTMLQTIGALQTSKKPPQ